MSKKMIITIIVVAVVCELVTVGLLIKSRYDLSRKINDGAQTVEALKQSEIAELQNAGTTMSADIAAMETSIAGLNEQINVLRTNGGHTEEIAKLQAAADSAAVTLTELQTANATLNAAVTALQTQDAARAAELAALQTANANLSAEVTALKTANAGIATDVTALQTANASLATDVTALQTANAGLATDVTALQTANAGLATDVTALQTASAGLATDVTALQTANAGLATDVTALQTASAGLATDVTALQTANAGLATDVTALQTASAGLATDVTALQTANAGLATDVTALQTSNAEIGAAVNAGNTRLTQVENWIDEYQRRNAIQVTMGSIIRFGHYNQDNDLDDGNEPIEWIVAEMQGNKALLVSRYVLDCQVYNANSEPTTWESSSIRAWLNSLFLNTAFTELQQTAICETVVDNSAATGYANFRPKDSANTTDRVFLLSSEEAMRYFASDRKATATDYVRTRNIARDNVTGAVRWWLRSAGGSANEAAAIYTNGVVRTEKVVNNRIGVRPAIWVNIEAESFNN